MIQQLEAILQCLIVLAQMVCVIDVLARLHRGASLGGEHNDVDPIHRLSLGLLLGFCVCEEL